MDTKGRKWYLTIIAASYFILCSSASLYYLSLHIRGEGTAVSLPVQLVSLGMAISADLYFFKPKLGHRGLLLMTIITLLFLVRTDNPKATAFHIAILLILLVPLMAERTKRKVQLTVSERGHR